MTLTRPKLWKPNDGDPTYTQLDIVFDLMRDEADSVERLIRKVVEATSTLFVFHTAFV